MSKLSVVISAYNEEEKIKECLESVKWADEIIIVDNQSTDKTVKIAKKYTKRIYSRPNNPMLNVNKNYGFKKAKGDWILSLDADERVTDLLKNEIIKTINQKIKRSKDQKINGYWISRKNIIFGKWIRYTGWYPDYQLRLFRRDYGRFAEEHVHEMIKVKGNTARLKNHIIHLNYQTISQFIKKLDLIYTQNEAENLIKKGYKAKAFDALRFPAREFLNRYFANKGYKDGLHGLILSLLMSFYHLVIFAKIWEKQGFKKKETSIDIFDKEINKIKNEMNYWIKKTKFDQEKRILKRIFIKILG